jgi:hypothetical protein
MFGAPAPKRSWSGFDLSDFFPPDLIKERLKGLI